MTFNLLSKVPLKDNENLKNMNVRYGIPVLFICCGIFILLLNILGNPTNSKRPKSHFRVIYKKSDSSNLSDLTNFKFEISTECKASNIIWIVTSYAGDASERSALRRAYNSKELSELGIQRVFLLGILDDVSQKQSGISQAAIENESQKFKDIVQGNFFEAYRNLTYKHLMGLKWSVENCVKIPYIMKMDDDTVVNLYEILDILKNINMNNSIAGYVLKNKPIREPASKWYVTKDEYFPDSYPLFVSGWFYITTYSVASKLINQAKSYSKYFWIDDVFITGILRERSNIQLVNIYEMFAIYSTFLKCCIEGGKNGMKCEFSIGPNGGDAELQVQFQEFADLCQFKCDRRPKELAVQRTCVVTKGIRNNENHLGKGSAEIRPINII